MSGSDTDTKPAQSGLVDMGDISFYNDPPDPTPTFTISDLENSDGTAVFGNSFSEIVLNVTWAQLQPNQGGKLDTSVIENAISLVSQYNSTNHTDLGIKLRVYGGYTAPSWAQNIDGPPITVVGAGTVDPHHDQVETIGRFWTADYIDAWNSFQQQLAAAYDDNPVIRGISNTAGAAATDEPFVPLVPDQAADLVSGGYTDAAEQLTLRSAISDYTGWSTTPLDYTMNMFHLEDNGKVTADPDFTLAVLQGALTSGRIVQAGNHALNNPLPSADAFVYAQMAADAELDPATPPGSYQTASPVNLTDYSNWGSVISQGVGADAGDIELWDGPGTTGFTGLSASAVANLATILAAGTPPATGAPDNGKALQFVAPASLAATTGSIAFNGTGAVLLASAPGATSYIVTIVSTHGDTLQVANFATLAGGVASGSTLSFSGSLDQVNTTLASLTDTLSQAGTDVEEFTATDDAGGAATRNVGVASSTGNTAVATTADPVPASAPPIGLIYTWTGAGSDTLFSNLANWTPSGGPPALANSAVFAATPSLVTVSGTGTAANLVIDTNVVPGGGSSIVVGQAETGDVDIADQPGTAGALILGGVNSSLTVAGNLEVGGVAGTAGGVGSLLAALSPGAYSSTTLSVAGTLQVWGLGSARMSGALAAGAIDVTSGGTISGNGTLSAATGTFITNDGVIEAVTDQTLGMQQLTVPNSITSTGSGTLVVDPGAALVLGGVIDSTQTVAFAPNSIAQFANDPYSPSSLVLENPLVTAGTFASPTFAGTITGFSFADSLVLDGVNGVLPATSAYSDGTLTVIDVTTNATLEFALSGTLDHLIPEAAVSNSGTGTITTITFVAAGLGQLPSVSAPSALQAETTAPVLVPDIVLNTPLPANPNNNNTVLVTISDTNGTLTAGNNNGNTTITQDGSNTIILAGSLGSVERSLQTLAYQSSIAGSDAITLTVSDYDGTSAPATIAVTTGTGAASFLWTQASNGVFGNAAAWKTSGSIASTPPGGADFAVFNNGASSNPYTVSGDGAVGRLDIDDNVTFTGQITAQGEGVQAVIVDSTSGEADMTLAGGALLTAQQAAIVGDDGQGVLTLMGGALNLTNTETAASELIIGDGTTSTGTVLDYEQITALGSVIVGASGTGTLRMLGVAATTSDGGADIGQNSTGHGIAVVDGGFWNNAGQLIVGDAGAGSLLVGGDANNVTGQVSAQDAIVGSQQGGSGTITLDHGDLIVANGTTTTSTFVIGSAGAGTLAIDGGNATIGAPIVTNSTTLYNGTLIVGASATASGVVSIDDGGSLLVDGNSAVGAGGDGVVTVGTSATDTGLFAMTGSLTIGASGQVLLGGQNATLRADDITIAAGGTLSGAGVVSGDGGGNGTVILAAIDNAGTITADGDLLVYGGVTGTGTLALDTDATITLQATVGAGETLSFASEASAVLNDVIAFAGTITDFAVHDVLDLASTAATGADWQDGVLSLLTGSGTISLHVAGNYAPNDFTVQSDGLGGTKVELACFAAGTRILTPDGLVAIDSLAVGDRVVTLTGECKPIRWIGRRRVDCRRHPRPGQVWPIRIKAGAFGPRRPAMDLYLSPDHALYVDGVLIPAKYLLNGTTLRQMRVPSVTYYHLELAAHDIILAEALPAETYLNTGNRSAFTNVTGAIDLFPDFSRLDNSLRWDASAYAPLCVTGPIVDATRAHLAARARELRGVRFAAHG